ncbi:hypothetical protein [Pelagibius sp.]|uniref:hypothetical protein n=1 Tax=Pelagibius sp. TaxID=1931238 RepID=UPI002629D50E|nr:hypothetical protein [Pelagibius sp.]
MGESLGLQRGGSALRRLWLRILGLRVLGLRVLGLQVLARLGARLGARLRRRRRPARPEAMSEHMLRNLGLSEMVRGAPQTGEADFGRYGL